MNPDLRAQFPILQRTYNNRPLVFLDGPAGTQVPTSVINRMSEYYKISNANTHGQFITTHETDQMMASVRDKMAQFLGAEGGHCISFGQNMTSLNYKLARAFSRVLNPGDEVLITQLDHEANRGPWLTLRDHGIIVREVGLEEDGSLNYADFEKKINEKTRLVAVGLASNIFGTVNNIEHIRNLTYQVGALLLLDAVHYAPHFSIDVQSIGCDFLLCSAYKFYGPHVGILYSKPGLLDSLPTDRLRTQEQKAPYRIETGTLNHAALAGVGAAIDFIASIGHGQSLRYQLVDAMTQIHAYEKDLVTHLYQGLRDIQQVEVWGPSIRDEERAPTISFTYTDLSAEQVCRILGQQGICAWDGHFYAIRATEVLGLLELGGVTRMGITMYNTKDEIDRTLEALSALGN